MRPAYNRPEMLQLSIEYEIEARKTANIKDNEYLTFFLIEYGAPKKNYRHYSGIPVSICLPISQQMVAITKKKKIWHHQKSFRRNERGI
jgi:hypothetical protein